MVPKLRLERTMLVPALKMLLKEAMILPLNVYLLINNNRNDDNKKTLAFLLLIKLF